MIADYFDESGNTGDLGKATAPPDFGGQRMFALACIGISDLSAFETEMLKLKKLHRIQGSEIKSTQLKAKSGFIGDVLELIDRQNLPVFIEAVDKHYALVANIIERLVVPYMSPKDLLPQSRRMKSMMADYLAVHGPESIVQNFVKACDSRSGSDLLKLYTEIISWAHQSTAHPDIAGAIKKVCRG